MLRFEVELGGQYDVKLALTSWAKGAFEVLHDLPPPPPPVKEGPASCVASLCPLPLSPCRAWGSAWSKS